MAQIDPSKKEEFIGFKASEDFKKAIEYFAYKEENIKNSSELIRKAVFEKMDVEDSDDLQKLVNKYEREKKTYPDKL